MIKDVEFVKKLKSRKKALIVAGFPGVGKSHMFREMGLELELADSDSSDFSWIKDKDGNNTDKRNPNFITDYEKHITGLVEWYDIIFISTHADVLSSMSDIIDYILIPDIKSKDEYIKRYKRRGSPDAFITFLSKNWDDFLGEIIRLYGDKVYVMPSGEYLIDSMKKIVENIDD